jgi:hypothetical protein
MIIKHVLGKYANMQVLVGIYVISPSFIWFMVLCRRAKHRVKIDMNRKLILWKI